MKEMTVEKLISLLQDKSEDHTLTIRAYEGKRYILIGIDIVEKEETNEGD